MDWENLAKAAVITLGLMEWIKGFANHSGKTIDGNVLRIVQFVLCITLAAIMQYLPVFVTTGLLTLSITTLCKTQIMDMLTIKLGGKK